jgi:dynein heavy chain 1
LGRIQKVVDELNLASYSNLDMWVSNLDKTVESILGQRLQEAVTAWIALIEEKEEKASEEGDAEARRLKMGSRNRCALVPRSLFFSHS